MILEKQFSNYVNVFSHSTEPAHDSQVSINDSSDQKGMTFIIFFSSTAKNTIDAAN